MSDSNHNAKQNPSHNGANGCILEMRNITKSFAGVKALDDVSFDVMRGEIHALCGENGAGKSTLMNVLSGVYPHGSYSGDIIFEGEACGFRSIRDSEKKGIVIIHQELALSPHLSIAENVYLGNEQTSKLGVIDWNATKSRAQEILKLVGMENEELDVPVNKLGVGKQQLIEIAKALAKDVKLLILDEPTAALNDEESQKLLELLLSLQKEGITSIMISHKLNELSQVADSITVLRDGKTIETIDRSRDEIDEDRIIRGMVGREITNRYPARQSNIGDIALEIKHWNVYHPDDEKRQLIRDVSINVCHGEVVGLAGLMGAGRTELAMSIFGKAYGQNISGEILKDHEPIKVDSISDAINNGIAYLSEDRKEYGLVLINDVKWNMSLPSLKQFSKGLSLNKNEEVKAANEYKERINIKANSLEQTVSSLSGGNQQKVVLAKWMMASPDVLILDEPTRGIDVGAKYEIYTVINQLAGEGKAVIVISSDMQELLGICDRIYVVNEGEIAGELSREEVSQELIMKTIMTHLSRDKNVGN